MTTAAKPLLSGGDVLRGPASSRPVKERRHPKGCRLWNSPLPALPSFRSGKAAAALLLWQLRALKEGREQQAAPLQRRTQQQAAA